MAAVAPHAWSVRQRTDKAAAPGQTAEVPAIAARRAARHCPIPGAAHRKDKTMTVARITEISSVSKTSFQDAIDQGVARANKTLKNVRGAWVKDQEVTVDDGKVTGYKVILKVTFILTD
jgi:dodecin